MKLNGIHHITAVTGDAVRNVDFYARLLGLRLVKKSVNQDEPTIYHLFYGDEHARPGADMTFFEFPGAARGVAGPGMVHRIIWKIRDEAAAEFWIDRLRGEGVEVEQLGEGGLRFRDFEGLEHELAIAPDDNDPLTADAPGIPAEHALQGFAGARAYSLDPQASREFLTEVMGFTARDGEEHGYDARGDRRTATWHYDTATTPGRLGGGTVHHIAWFSLDEDHEAWRERIAGAGYRPTPVIDRFYFRSIYYTEPSRVLFELATESPGFTADEPLESLGERLSLPPKFEPLRAQLEQTLTPLPNPRASQHA